MIGWCVVWWCRVAWRFGDESQQATWPQVKHSRRCTHSPPILRQSSQPGAGRLTWRILISATCSHGALMSMLIEALIAEHRTADHAVTVSICTFGLELGPGDDDAIRLTRASRTGNRVHLQPAWRQGDGARVGANGPARDGAQLPSGSDRG